MPVSTRSARAVDDARSRSSFPAHRHAHPVRPGPVRWPIGNSSTRPCGGSMSGIPGGHRAALLPRELPLREVAAIPADPHRDGQDPGSIVPSRRCEPTSGPRGARSARRRSREGRSHDDADAPRALPASLDPGRPGGGVPPPNYIDDVLSTTPRSAASGRDGRSPKGGSPWLRSPAAQPFAPRLPWRTIAVALLLIALLIAGTVAVHRLAAAAPAAAVRRRPEWPDHLREGRRRLHGRSANRSRDGHRHGSGDRIFNSGAPARRDQDPVLAPVGRRECL